MYYEGTAPLYSIRKYRHFSELKPKIFFCVKAMKQNPEQKARDKIDQMLLASGWVMQHRSEFNRMAAKV